VGGAALGGQRRVENADRLAALTATGLLERPASPGLDRLTRLASRLLGAPTSLVSLVTDERQVFASQLGLPEPWSSAGETPLSHSFCQHVVDDDAPLVVADARTEERLRGNRAIDEIGVIAYAGMPIRVAGQTLGAFCAIDGVPRVWDAEHLAVLEDLAAAVSSEIALIKAVDDAQQREATTRAILDVSHDAYLANDADGTVVEWNPAAEALFGWSRSEAVGADLTDLILTEKHRAEYVADLARVRAGGRSRLTGRRLQMPAVDRHGRSFPAELTMQLTRTGGRPVYHAFLHDISARREAEQQLRRQAELIDAAPTAIIVRGLDGTIRFWNRGAEQMYGFPATAVIGRNLHHLLAAEFPEPVRDIEQVLLSTGVWEGEAIHRHACGRTLVTLSRHALRRAADGADPEVIEMNTDITQRRRAEQALAASERQFRTQFDQSTIGQAIVGLDGRIIEVNQAYADMLGHTPADLCGRPDVELTHPDDRPSATRLLGGLIAGEYESYQRTKRVLHADGHTLDVRIGVRLVRDDDGAPLQLIGVIENVTEQLRAQRERDAAAAALEERNAQLEQANQLKLDLMGMLSHDIGTPLAAIAGYSELLLEEPLPEPAPGLLTRVRRAVQRIDELRHNVLAMCTLDAGAITARRQPVALAAALREAVEAAGTDLEADCPADLRVMVNPAHLQQIVVNFLTNAVKYGGGPTAVSVRAHTDTVSIAVHDEGPGVPAALRPALFDRYTRADDAIATAGHGLGLYIVASLAQANQGTVSHRDNSPHGSVFALRLQRCSP
jgi:PAS domain S-box-containing protein